MNTVDFDLWGIIPDEVGTAFVDMIAEPIFTLNPSLTISLKVSENGYVVCSYAMSLELIDDSLATNYVTRQIK